MDPGGTFRMGSDRHTPEEAPSTARRSPRLDRLHAGHNRQFREFVAATDHVSYAEIAPDPKDIRRVADMLKAGSLVFTPPRRPVDLSDGEGGGSSSSARTGVVVRRGRSNHGLDDHPVSMSHLQDAEAYAAWAGKALPTEAEWEYAGGAARRCRVRMGDELTPGAAICQYLAGCIPARESRHRRYARNLAGTSVSAQRLRPGST